MPGIHWYILILGFLIFLVSRNHFQAHYVIGQGGFGKVWKVELTKTKEIFAMKEMKKAK
jgi:hypothetical protein